VGSEAWHEPYEQLTPETRDLHRAIVSLMEELEAVDWYQQRATITPDEELKAVLLHHRNEEIEHAMMNLEWIRRKDPVFDETARTYLFTEGPITAVEEAATGGAEPTAPGDGATASKPAPSDGSLGIGSLKLT
jgi:uncharacterized protein